MTFNLSNLFSWNALRTLNEYIYERFWLKKRTWNCLIVPSSAVPGSLVGSYHDETAIYKFAHRWTAWIHCFFFLYPPTISQAPVIHSATDHNSCNFTNIIFAFLFSSFPHVPDSKQVPTINKTVLFSGKHKTEFIILIHRSSHSLLMLI